MHDGSPCGFALLLPRLWPERRRERLLHGSLDALEDALVNPGLPYRDLRHVTPFAGVLSASERTAVYREFRRDETQR